MTYTWKKKVEKLSSIKVVKPFHLALKNNVNMLLKVSNYSLILHHFPDTFYKLWSLNMLGFSCHPQLRSLEVLPEHGLLIAVSWWATAFLESPQQKLLGVWQQGSAAAIVCFRLPKHQPKCSHVWPLCLNRPLPYHILLPIWPRPLFAIQPPLVCLDNTVRV